MINNMKKCYLDSNIIIAAKDKDSRFHPRAKKILLKLIEKNYLLCLSPLVLDEALFQIQYLLRRRGLFKKEKEILRDFVTSIFLLPNITLVNPPLTQKAQIKVVKFITQYQLRPRDAYHLLIIKSHKIDNIATFDKDFVSVAKVEKIKIIAN